MTLILLRLVVSITVLDDNRAGSGAVTGEILVTCSSERIPGEEGILVMRTLMCLLAVCVLGQNSSQAANAESFLLAADLAEGDTSQVEVTLEVGGDLLFTAVGGETKKMPLTVAGHVHYLEQLLAWSSEPDVALRSYREYQTATATIQIDDAGMPRELPSAKQKMFAEVRDAQATLAGADSPLTRDEFDLVNLVGNSLALNRLLPGREMSEGDGWDHDTAAIGSLLGMDHVAVCEVRSVVTGNVNRQVQIRLAGTVHGTIDGAPTEMQLRGAYLFHQDQQRINKFNLAIQEQRTASQIVPGLDVVAKVSVTVKPSNAEPSDKVRAEARDTTQPLSNHLRYEAPSRGYQFHHDPAWYVTSEPSDLVSLGCLQQGNSTAYCKVSTLPARSEGHQTTLEQFEGDIRQSLGDNLETVSASTEWTTEQGHECLGVVAQGQVEGVPIEWRYYLIASPGLPRVSLAVTIEQSQLETFNDADRQLVESMELLASPTTAQKPSNQSTR